MNYLYAAAGSIILVFIFLILKKENKNKADYLLIAVNILVGFFLIADVLVNWRLTSSTVIFQNSVPLFLFPVFVFYVLQFINANKKIAKSWYLIFAPGLIFLVFSFFDHFILNNYPSQTEVDQYFNTPSIWNQLIFKSSQLLYISILIWLLGQLRNFEMKLKEGYSTIETIDVKWLRHFTWVYLGSIIFTFILFLSQNLGILPFEIKQVFAIIYGVLIISVFYLNYQGIQHYTLIQVHPAAISNENDQDELINENHKRDELTEKELEIEKLILEKIESEQLYLEPKFSLNEMADKLGKSKHLISKIINSKKDRSFYDLINGYRVSHLKKMMDDPKNSHFTILALGLDSGFNSKASLNRIFKNTTGLTPKEYLDLKSQSIEAELK